MLFLWDQHKGLKFRFSEGLKLYWVQYCTGTDWDTDEIQYVGNEGTANCRCSLNCTLKALRALVRKR